jgi:hypothetical protein
MQLESPLHVAWSSGHLQYGQNYLVLPAVKRDVLATFKVKAVGRQCMLGAIGAQCLYSFPRQHPFTVLLLLLLLLLLWQLLMQSVQEEPARL